MHASRAVFGRNHLATYLVKDRALARGMLSGCVAPVAMAGDNVSRSNCKKRAASDLLYEHLKAREIFFLTPPVARRSGRRQRTPSMNLHLRNERGRVLLVARPEARRTGASRDPVRPGIAERWRVGGASAYHGTGARDALEGGAVARSDP